MLDQIAHQEIANDLNEWYKSIKQRDKGKATQLHQEIRDRLPNMSENQTVLLYYSLIESRYELLMERFNKSGEILNNINKMKDLEKNTDDMIQYYFYFFSGVYEFYQKNFTQAINYYKIAESMLHKIPDEMEMAEFHYQVAVAYYRIDQHIFSISHAEKALESFKANSTYYEREIYSEMILAANKLDMLCYKESEANYLNAIEKSKSAGSKYSESLAYFNLGLCYGRQKLYSKAAESFINALSNNELKNGVVGIKAILELTHVLYKNNKSENAQSWYKKGFSRAEKEGEKEYEAKFIFIDGLYNTSDTLSMQKGLGYLESQNLWTDVSELCLDAAHYYKNMGDTANSSLYFEKAHYARDQILKLLEELK
ncbi:response regulator aspartate phosphatase [Bacillus swezeyi]|uniref:Uncharacterized protein n=1 Tax=Bacillus swezeyi TaxID=1925020 RepID=A0A5M8REF2_9BACI|nr:hypothetical protein [Bacillus swezeyi]KAA6446955.1 hypothetical protein DX927_23185 [Bacillus swezeyi]KAA6471523.1 hypothetical protein DX928_23425 [Bacillus swezeyi]